MSKLALLFPGQGSQKVGMGREFYDQVHEFRTGFVQIAKLLDIDLEYLCFEENDLLNETEYAQVAITSVSALIYDQIQKSLKGRKLYFAGHSLGEFGALYAANVWDLETMLKLVRYRGNIMAETALIHPGKMAAIIGGDSDKIQTLCLLLSEEGNLVQIANYNLPSQTVISGTASGLEEFSKHLLEVGGKRMIYLKVSGAFHSELMQDAALKLLKKIQYTKKNIPEHPVIMNANAKEIDIDKLDETIAMQLMRPVRFYESIEYLLSIGIDTFVEIGPANVLTNMVKKIAPEAVCLAINTPEDINSLEALL